MHIYRPQSRGDNTFDSVRPSVNMFGSICLYWRGVVDISTWLAKYSRRSSETQVSYTLKKCSSQGAFKMVGHSKWLLFQHVAPSRSIALLIRGSIRQNAQDPMFIFEFKVLHHRSPGPIIYV